MLQGECCHTCSELHTAVCACDAGIAKCNSECEVNILVCCLVTYYSLLDFQIAFLTCVSEGCCRRCCADSSFCLSLVCNEACYRSLCYCVICSDRQTCDDLALAALQLDSSFAVFVELYLAVCAADLLLAVHKCNREFEFLICICSSVRYYRLGDSNLTSLACVCERCCCCCFADRSGITCLSSCEVIVSCLSYCVSDSCRQTFDSLALVMLQRECSNSVLELHTTVRIVDSLI